ncbi:uncharacterized protein EI97DRAFT_437203, partial [Westerdykella ornata]
MSSRGPPLPGIAHPKLSGGPRLTSRRHICQATAQPPPRSLPRWWGPPGTLQGSHFPHSRLALIHPLWIAVEIGRVPTITV